MPRAEPRLTRALFAIALALAGLCAASLVWWVLGADSHPLVVRAVLSASLAGLILGFVAPLRWTVSAPTRLTLLLGLGLHPAAWVVYVLWARWSPVAPTIDEPGHVLQSLYSAIVWSTASIPFGAAVTLPAVAFSVLGTRHVSRATQREADLLALERLA